MGGDHMQGNLISSKLIKRKSSVTDLVFAVLIGFFFLLLLLKYVALMDIPRNVFLLIFAAAALFGDDTQIVLLGICCIPFNSLFQNSFGLGICIIVYVLKHVDKIRFRPEDGFLAFLPIWEVLHLVSYDFTLKEFIALWLPYIFLILIVRTNQQEVKYPVIVRFLAYTTLYICFLLLLQLFIRYDFNFKEAFNNLYRLDGSVWENANIVVNPNTLGFLVILSMIGLLQLKFNCKKSLNITTIMILSLFGLLTTSRTYLVCLVMTFILFVLSTENKANKKLKIISVSVAVTLVSVLIFYFVAPTTFNFFLDRVLYGGDGARTKFFVFFNDVIFSNPKIFLWGLGLYNLAGKQMDMYGFVSHNGLQEILLAWGFFGFILYIGFICSLLYSGYIRNRKIKLINFIPFIIFLVKSQAGQLVTYSVSPLIYLFCYFSLIFDFEKDAATR